MTSYTVTTHVQHDDDGDLDVDVKVEGVGHSVTDRASIAWALRQAADMVETGAVVPKEMFS